MSTSSGQILLITSSAQMLLSLLRLRKRNVAHTLHKRRRLCRVALQVVDQNSSLVQGKTQECLEESNRLTPSRHILLALRQTWDLERIHGLPAVVAPVFFPSGSRNEECWWGTPDPRSIYVWDSLDDQDKQTSMTTLQETENWVVWKTRDKIWTHTLKKQDFHQLLSFKKSQDKKQLLNTGPLERENTEGNWGNV